MGGKYGKSAVGKLMQARPSMVAEAARASISSFTKENGKKPDQQEKALILFGFREGYKFEQQYRKMYARIIRRSKEKNHEESDESWTGRPEARDSNALQELS